MKVKTLLLLFCRKASRFSNLLNENNNETKFISSAKLSRCYNESFGLEFHIFNFFSSIRRFSRFRLRVNVVYYFETELRLEKRPSVRE